MKGNPTGRPTRAHRRLSALAGSLTVLGTLDPQDAASLAAILRRLEALLQSYRAAGDMRPLRVYVGHVPKEAKED